MQSKSTKDGNSDSDLGKRSKYSLIGEYASSMDSKHLDLTVYSVALVKVDAGANFTSLVTSTPESTLYIDLSNAVDGQGTQVDTKGFLKENVYFITRMNGRIPLEEVRLIAYGILAMELTYRNEKISFKVQMMCIIDKCQSKTLMVFP